MVFLSYRKIKYNLFDNVRELKKGEDLVQKGKLQTVLIAFCINKVDCFRTKGSINGFKNRKTLCKILF